MSLSESQKKLIEYKQNQKDLIQQIKDYEQAIRELDEEERIDLKGEQTTNEFAISLAAIPDSIWKTLVAILGFGVIIVLVMITLVVVDIMLTGGGGEEEGGDGEAEGEGLRLLRAAPFQVPQLT